MRRAEPKAHATIRITFRTKNQSDSIAAALRPEIHHPAGQKARARVLASGRKLNLHFEANDSTALRAIMSSYLRMLQASTNVSEALILLERFTSTKRKRKKTD